MKSASMEIIRFQNEDVICTSDMPSSVSLAEHIYSMNSNGYCKHLLVERVDADTWTETGYTSVNGINLIVDTYTIRRGDQQFLGFTEMYPNFESIKREWRYYSPADNGFIICSADHEHMRIN